MSDGDETVIAHGSPGPASPHCFGPYLRYAIATGFSDFKPTNAVLPPLFLLIAFKQPGAASAFAGRMQLEAGVPVALGPDSDRGRFATAFIGSAGVTKPDAMPIWETCVDRVELSVPIEPVSLPPQTRMLRHRTGSRKQPGPLLIGMLDDGCPFAAAHFLRGPASTRVRSIWDQSRSRQPVEWKDRAGAVRCFGEVPKAFRYGLEFRRGPGSLSSAKQIDLDEWIALHTTGGSIDEDGCYADGGFGPLRARQSHGAHVMDALAGRVPVSSRLGPSGPGADRRDPPSWRLATDPASRADIVFVQFSDACIADATGVWLKAYVFDGIRYILSFVDPKHTKHVVINVSYGITTGPHNGISDLELALQAFVADFNGTSGKPKLEIVLPAGNSYLSGSHIAHIRQPGSADSVAWTWRLLPDNPVVCFAEVWIAGNAGTVTVTLTAPSGAAASAGASVPASRASAPTFRICGPIVRGADTLWLLAVQATRGAAEHGDWRITVSGLAGGAEVHAYVARSDPNMGARTGAKRSYFRDDAWEADRAAEAALTYAEGVFDDAGSLIDRTGTLNGIATAQEPRLHVAGGYIVANGRPSPYSSAGPARAGPLATRAGPDFLLPCDGSYALKGIPAGGNRSGSVVRLVGTSTAAPQLARHLADPPVPPATDVPTTPAGIARRGGGNLKPA